MTSTNITRQHSTTSPPSTSDGEPSVSDIDNEAGDGRWSWRRIAGLGGWGLLAVVSLALYLRYNPAQRPITIALVGFFPLAVVPLIVAVPMALASRNNTLRASTALVALAFALTVSPVDAVIGCGPETADDQIVLLTANVLVSISGGATADAVAETIAEANPDVVVLEEVTDEFYLELRDNPKLDYLRYRTTNIDTMPIEDLIWSRWEFSSVSIQQAQMLDLPKVTVQSPYGPFDVIGVHTWAPAKASNVGPWTRQLEALGTVDTSRPVVMAGDFNATEDHYPFRQILDRGWTDIHDDKGCGPGATWPSKGVPAEFYRLDHVLLTDHFAPLSVELLAPKGSDHRPVLATFRFQT